MFPTTDVNLNADQDVKIESEVAMEVDETGANITMAENASKKECAMDINDEAGL